MENNIPTARQFYDNHISDDCVVMMIEFAKLHVQEALEQASYNAKLASYDNKANKPGTSGFTTVTINDVEWRPCSESILSSYPLENIK